MIEILSLHHVKVFMSGKIFLAIICANSEDAIDFVGQIPSEANLPNPLEWKHYPSLSSLMDDLSY